MDDNKLLDTLHGYGLTNKQCEELSTAIDGVASTYDAPDALKTLWEIALRNFGQGKQYWFVLTVVKASAND